MKTNKQKENKTITKIMRMSEREWSKISSKINELGNISFSQYAIKSMLSRPLTKTPLTKELVLELSRQGNNLNQISQKLNSGQSFDKIGLIIINNTLEQLNAIYELLSDLNHKSSIKQDVS